MIRSEYAANQYLTPRYRAPANVRKAPRTAAPMFNAPLLATFCIVATMVAALI
jgi:hypothetical protein